MLMERVTGNRPHWSKTMCATPVIIIISDEDHCDEDFHEERSCSEAEEHRVHDYAERVRASRMDH